MSGPEFSRPLRVEQLPGRLSRHRIEADETERARLARRFGLVALDRLEAEIEIAAPTAAGLVRLRGRLSAELVQTCGVTLAPLPARIEAPFTLSFAPAAEEERGMEDELDLVWDDEDPPDPIEDGRIDLGEAVAEQLALALDPFPRAPDAAFVAPPEPEPEPPAKASPFAALAALRQKMG